MFGLVLAAIGISAVAVLTGVFQLTGKAGGGRQSSSGGGSVADSLLSLVKHYEGFHPNIYTCPAGYPTIGYGHVIVGGEPPAPWTEQQASEILAQELVEYENSAREAYEDRTGLRWNDLSTSERAAYTSAVYNAGPGIISNGSWIIQTDPVEKRERFYSWSKGGGQRLPGLVRRRFTEYKLATTGTLDFDPPGWQQWYNEHRG